MNIDVLRKKEEALKLSEESIGLLLKDQMRAFDYDVE